MQRLQNRLIFILNRIEETHIFKVDIRFSLHRKHHTPIEATGARTRLTIVDSPNTNLLKLHLILRQCARFIRENMINLSQLLIETTRLNGNIRIINGIILHEHTLIKFDKFKRN